MHSMEKQAMGARVKGIKSRLRSEGQIWVFFIKPKLCGYERSQTWQGWYPLLLRKSFSRGSRTGVDASSCKRGARFIFFEGVSSVSSVMGLRSRIISLRQSEGNLGTILLMISRSLKESTYSAFCSPRRRSCSLFLTRVASWVCSISPKN